MAPPPPLDHGPAVAAACPRLRKKPTKSSAPISSSISSPLRRRRGLPRLTSSAPASLGHRRLSQHHRTPARYRPGLIRPLSIASKPPRLLRVPARASRLTLVVSTWLLALLPCGFARGPFVEHASSSTSSPSSSSRCGVAAAMAWSWPPTPWCNGRLWLAPSSSTSTTPTPPVQMDHPQGRCN